MVNSRSNQKEEMSFFSFGKEENIWFFISIKGKIKRGVTVLSAKKL